MKKILVGIMAFMIATFCLSVVSAAPTGNEPIFNNPEWETRVLTLDTWYRNGEYIYYNVRAAPTGTETGDGKIIGHIRAKGAGNIPKQLKLFCQFGHINAEWWYVDFTQAHGHFENTSPTFSN